VFDDPLMMLSSYSFPSGHVLPRTLLYGLGLAIDRSWPRRHEAHHDMHGIA